MQTVVQRGGVVGGTSAGMAAIPEIMTLWDERESIDAPASVVPGHGLGLMRQAIVEQHFDARGGRLERFTSLLRDNQRLDELAQRHGAGARMVGLAVEESSALVVRGNHLQALGNANSHVFIKSAPLGSRLRGIKCHLAILLNSHGGPLEGLRLSLSKQFWLSSFTVADAGSVRLAQIRALCIYADAGSVRHEINWTLAASATVERPRIICFGGGFSGTEAKN